ncbi:MAG: galactose mutarotase [Clostridia bacterium]|nr:galactose mutarotase [Clostridia bacterium]
MEFILENENMRVVIDTNGATIKEIIFDGDNMICRPPYSASVIGRIAGRISHGKFSLNGTEYSLPKNENDNQLHGNHEFDRQAEWDASMFGDTVALKYHSPDGANGFPGDLDVGVLYTLTKDNELRINYVATSSKDTILNITNHAYFNLNGETANETVENHVLKANISKFVPLNDDLTPTGDLLDVKGTVFDLNDGRCIKDAIESKDSQCIIAKNGFDHAFIFENTEEVVHEAELICKEKNRIITMKTDYPCFVCYSGNQMKERPHMGICLEAQHLPDAINHDGFGSVVLEAGKMYNNFVSYKFGNL